MKAIGGFMDKLFAIVFLWLAASAVHVFVNSYPDSFEYGIKPAMLQQAGCAAILLFIYMLWWSIATLVS